MKKIMKSMLVFVLVAVMMCSVMVTAQAANDNTETPVGPDDPGGGGGGSSSQTENWIFDHFDWIENHPQKEYKAYAVYECRKSTGTETRSIIAAVTQDAPDRYKATIDARKSLDGVEHVDYYDVIHLWLFEGFDWIIEQEYSWSDRTVTSVMARFRCPSCGRIKTVKATVTGQYMATAYIGCEAALDGEEHSETIELNHEWIFDDFTWDLTNFTAKANYTCRNCHETCSIDADMAYPNVCQAKAYVDQYKSLDHMPHSELKDVDYGQYEPYGWEFGKVYQYEGIRWEKSGRTYKAYVKYKKGVMGGGVLYWLDTVEVEAVVTVSSRTLAYTDYKARLAAWQTPDGVERTDTKRVSNRFEPIDKPIAPRTGIGDIIIAPPGELKP